MKSDPDQLFASLSGTAQERLRACSQPKWTQPMLATLTDDPFSDEQWIYERKLDGERCLAFCRKKRIHLRSRNRKSLNATYPEIIDALKRQNQADYILDGEVVAFRRGVTSFARLQKRMQIKREEEARDSGVAVYYYVFDLLHLQGHDLAKLRLRDRKSLLRKLLQFKDPIRFTSHRVAEGESYLYTACKKGWEGLIAKKADGAYIHGRSRAWLKFKCHHEQEFVVGGYTDPQGSRTGFGALLLGYHDNGKLQYAGMVGTGFDEKQLQTLSRRLGRLERKRSPYADNDDTPNSRVHWVQPKLVVQVGFTEWTRDHKLRHPRYLGVRRDKKPQQVKRESPSS